jgi:hypothetical protein
MKRDRYNTRDDSAVSEAISYVLIFGLISLGTAIVVLQGGPAIDTTEQNQINENSERAITLVQERIDEMMRQNAPVREVSVELQDITVGVGGDMEPTKMNVTNVTSGESYKTTMDPVYIDTGSRTILYEGGAVMEGQQGINESWAMTSGPSWAVRTNGTGYVEALFIQAVSTTGDGEVFGEGRVRWVFESTDKTNENLIGVEDLNITVKSPRAGAWERYFEGINSSVNDSVDITPSTPDGQATMVMTDAAFDGEPSVSYDETVLSTEVE